MFAARVRPAHPLGRWGGGWLRGAIAAVTHQTQTHESHQTRWDTITTGEYIYATHDGCVNLVRQGTIKIFSGWGLNKYTIAIIVFISRSTA